MVFIKNKGFTLVELLVVVAILAILAAILLPRFLGYTDKAREAQTMKDIRSMCTVVEAFTATDGNYPEASLDTDNPRSIASIMQSKGVNWTGDATGKTDPWGNPYYYDVVDDYYCIASSGKNGTLDDNDDICNISGKVSKKASGLDGNAIPSATPGNNPGNGNEEHLSEVPYGYIGIYTPEQLASIGNDPDYPLDGNYIVMADLNLSGYNNWTPIANQNAFEGIFDGNNYTISHLQIGATADMAGLFCRIVGEATLKNVILADVDLDITQTGGALVGQTSGGTITECSVSGELSGTSWLGGMVGEASDCDISNCNTNCIIDNDSNDTGGLVGYNENSTISNCYSEGSMLAEEAAGGLVGYNNAGFISDSYSTVSIASNSSNVGGLVGSSTGGEITNCYSTGSVEGTGTVGGLIGYNVDTLISGSHSVGDVNSNASSTGGLIGNNSGGEVSNCYAIGDVDGSGDNTGGLIGNNSGVILCSYATGDVAGQGFCTGGLIGSNAGNISYSYSVGLVTSPNSGEGMPTGGFIGNNSGIITSCYYDQTTSGQSDDIQNGTPLTTAEMKDQVNFSGWDFDTVWDIDEGVSYPYLQTNEQIPHPGT